jgi:NADH:ubiquinone oxidoreductase subunit 3 (subunit A)
LTTLTINLIFIFILIIILLLINQLLSPRKPDLEKVSVYESGFSPSGDSRQKFSVQFYLVAILFIIFDLEVILLFPFAVTLYQNSIYGFWIIVLFIIILTIGYLYEYSKGALKFTRTSSSS